MADTLEIFGIEYANVNGIKATDNNGNVLTFSKLGGIAVASGTTVGSNNTGDVGRHQFSIGKKMPQTDFYFIMRVQNGTEFVYSATRQFVTMNVVCFHEYGSFDLSTTGNKTHVVNPSYTIDSNNSGTITQKNAGELVKFGRQIYNGNLDNAVPNMFQIRRQSDHFDIYIGISNGSYVFPAVNYDWKIVYFGTNPSEDIVEIL